MPIICKQVKERFPGGMFLTKASFTGNTKPRAVGKREATVRRIDLNHARNSLLDPGIREVVEMLLNFEVGCTCRNMKSRGGATGHTRCVVP